MLNNKPTMTVDDNATGRGPMMNMTHPQAPKQLLLGWITGGPTTTTTKGDTPPAPAVSKVGRREQTMVTMTMTTRWRRG